MHMLTPENARSGALLAQDSGHVLPGTSGNTTGEVPLLSGVDTYTYTYE